MFFKIQNHIDLHGMTPNYIQSLHQGEGNGPMGHFQLQKLKNSALYLLSSTGFWDNELLMFPH